MRRKGKGTELRNQTFKSDARKLAYKTLSNDKDAQAAGINASALKFDPITLESIDAYHLWGETVLYPWDNIPDWKRKDAKGLDLAIWYEGELCGLCYATPRKSTICIKIVLLQGRTSDTHPLRGWVAPMALLVTEFYARMLGCCEIEVQEPAPGVIPYYQKLGFDFDKTNRLVFSLDGQ
ncbi:hypothetical protein HK44_013725 [Pseudomonas fluorescens HK44]|uniref:N-acetyltransferase domain-containing protein n=1 Tax=Pseudomonas fluorescens HK44 TaxID=1042209 RepID=A0A010RGN9_PSEFL|nr:hypothetical protein [Pseudomonas fluorescens]EXF91861.1 hypothetical protein HK44_013725 [Pseudomonas fluorescens HK44]